jgi:hypothetical protein
MLEALKLSIRNIEQRAYYRFDKVDGFCLSRVEQCVDALSQVCTVLLHVRM